MCPAEFPASMELFLFRKQEFQVRRRSNDAFRVIPSRVKEAEVRCARVCVSVCCGDINRVTSHSVNPVPVRPQNG